MAVKAASGGERPNSREGTSPTYAATYISPCTHRTPTILPIWIRPCRARMKPRGIHLQYSFGPSSQDGAALSNPLFELLVALRDQGSILSAARQMGVSYRHFWGSLKRWEETLGQPLVHWVQGQPATLTEFSQRLLWAETRARTRLTPHIEALRAELARVLDEALEGEHPMLSLYASHDLALPHLQELARDAQRLHVALRFCGSVDALQALADGRCQVAGFHVPDAASGTQAAFADALQARLKPGLHKIIGCLRRTQGLMLAPGRAAAVHGLADVAAQRLRWINRQPGSGTRLWADALLERDGLRATQISGWQAAPEHSHLAVAAAIASGLADAGPGVQAAATHFGLDFVPLAQEDYFLVCLKEALEQAPLQRLRSVLASSAWKRSLGGLAGYAPHPTPGLVLSLTRELPWWRWPTRRGAESVIGTEPNAD
jgi:putative molybdopterin biosynthesis protein